LILLGAYAPAGALEHDRFFAFEIASAGPPSLHWLLGARGKALSFVEADDVAVARVSRSFDLPRATGPSAVAAALMRIASGEGKGMRGLALLQNAFSSAPNLFEDLWAEVGGGKPISVHPFEAREAAWNTTDTGRHLQIASHTVRETHKSEQRHGIRQQHFGTTVLRADLGICPECGGAMIRTEEGPRCKRDLERATYDAPNDRDWLYGTDTTDETAAQSEEG
jgi:hypothetical protein